MGFLDDMFNMKKESVKPRTARAAVSKKEPGKKQISENTTPSRTSFFGSLRRGAGGTTSTPKSAKSSDAEKTKGTPQLRNKPPDKEKKPWFRSTTNGILGKDQINSSDSSLNVTAQKSSNVTERKRRPLTISLTPNVTVRRGQNAKLDGQNLPDNLSRTSSITNLDADQKVGKGAKPRKSSSRDRLDKVGENKKNDKKGVTKNNNKLDSGDSPYPSIDSLQEEEFLQLRRQLQEMAQEKSNLALQLGEQKGQLNILQKEIHSLKSFQEESNLQLEQLAEENTALRNRLRDVAHSPLSDNEKQQLLYETHQRHHSSAPASIATNLIDEGNGGDITACPTPDWDKHSSSNVSEVSVACLQDKINQMQETHYSTNEELQATLQELTDLQRQLTELQQENERLNEEKTLMFDSLCRQTERLNDSRSEVESLKQLFYREKDETGQYESAIEREQKLVGLLKSAQEEKQALMLKLEQVNNEVQEARSGIIEKDERVKQLSERVRTLESTLDAKHAEHKLIDQELAQAKDQCSGKQIEINRLTDLLDNARTKISELEQDRALSDKSELDELLDNARKEKDSLESEVAHLKEQLAISKNEIEKLKEQVSILQEECKVIRNNARTKQSDLEYKCEKLLLEKNKLSDQLSEFQEAVNELQVQSQCQLEDKRQLSAVLSETQRNLSEAERKNLTLETELQELRKVRNEEVEEWEKFQNDLLTSVRVANDFKTEAQQELQRMILENKSYREKERQLKSEIEKLKGDKKDKRDRSPITSNLTEKRNVPDMENFLGLSKRSRDKAKKSTGTNASGKDDKNKDKKSEKSAKTASTEKDDKHKDKKPDPLTAKDDKTKDKKPDMLTKMVKRREKQPARNKKNKTLSVEEEILLKSLNDWYENIDKNIPEDKLTEEQRVIKKLKTLYEDDSLKEKPIAHKPKNMLAISKPLLDSVFLNPKLEEIAKDPNMPTIEENENFYFPHDEIEVPELRTSPQVPGRHGGVRSVDYVKPKQVKRDSILGRSKSCDDLFSFDEKHQSRVLYRSVETEDLRKDASLVPVERDSSILPSDSVSNPRYSDFAYAINKNVTQKKIKEKPDVTKVSRNSSINFETLELIVSSIPENATEDQLTSEQKFALRLKKALDEAEKKNTLKKKYKTKHVDISSPTMDSVEKNKKLKDILLNPKIRSVRTNSVADSVGLYFNDPVQHSKSCQDISFSFNNNDNKSFGSNESTLGDSYYGFTRKSSLTETFSSAEFDTETGLKSPLDSTKLTSFKEGTVENAEDLLYNETINKKNRGSKEIDTEVILRKKEKTSSLVYDSEDDRSRNHVATIITSKEYSTLLSSLPRDRTKISDMLSSELPTFRVKPSEDEVDRKQCLTVIQSEEQTAVLNNTYNAGDFSRHSAPTNLKVTSDEDEVDRNCVTTVIQPKDFRAVFTASSSDMDEGPKPSKNVFKVASVGDEVDRNRTTTVIQPIELRAVFTTSSSDMDEGPKPSKRVFKVASVGDDIEENHAVTVIPEKEYTAVLTNNTEERLTFRVQSPEDEIDKTHYTTVVPVEEHTVLFEDTTNKISSPELTDEEAPTFKVQTLDEVGFKNYAVVNVSKEYIPVFEDWKDDKELSDLRAKELPTFTVQTLEEEDDKNPSLTVTQSEEYIAVLDGSQDGIWSSSSEPPTFKVLSFEDEDKDENAAVILQDEHIAVLDDSQFSDLTYNETLNKKLISKEQNINEELSDSEEIGRATVIPDIIVDLGNNSTIPQDDLLTPDKYDVDYEVSSWNALDEEEQNAEYDYHAILKENRYGVTSPLNIRLSYKDVVKEFKTRFPTNKSTNIDQSAYDLEESNEFLDDFFGISRGTDQIVSDSEEVKPIDMEMEEIFEKYLHTPVSKVITEIESDDRDKIEEDEISSPIIASHKKNDTTDDKNITKVEVKQIGEESYKVDDVDNTLPQQVLLEDKDAALKPSEQFSADDIDNTISQQELSDTDPVLKLSEKFIAADVDAIAQQELCVKEPTVKIPEKIIADDADNNLTKQELDLIRSLKNIRFSRPLSDFNEKDLLIIERLSTQYLPNTEKFHDDKNKSPLDSDEGKTKESEDISSTTINLVSSIPQDEGDFAAVKIVYENNDLELPSRKIDDKEIVFVEKESERNITDKEKVRPVETDESSQINDASDEKYQENYNDRVPVTPSLTVTQGDQMEAKEIPDEDNSSIANNAGYTVNKTAEVHKDDVDMILKRMLAPRVMPKKRPEDQNFELKKAKSNVTLRKTDFESVKTKFEILAKASVESSSIVLNRQSLNPHSNNPPQDRRKVKSWAEHFEKRSLDTRSAYEPVYENLETVNLEKKKLELASRIDKKPLPMPRTKNLGSIPAKNDDSSLSIIGNDLSVKERKMSDCKIISESDTENLSQEVLVSDFGKVNVLDIPVYSETSRAIPKDSPKETENEESVKVGVLGINKSEKFLDMHDGCQKTAVVKEEAENLASAAETSYSSIAVAGKFEELDITKHSNDMEEIMTSGNESRLNLFNLETASYDESYLSLFKSPEEKMYEDISGSKKPHRGYYLTYLGEISDSESCDEVNQSNKGENSLGGNKSKPKIIDFVPLDDATQPVFNKELRTNPIYDTLEREKTFQVLNMAASTGAVKKATSITENQNSAAPSSSRISFSAAKKVFETLLENNNEAVGRVDNKNESSSSKKVL